MTTAATVTKTVFCGLTVVCQYVQLSELASHQNIYGGTQNAAVDTIATGQLPLYDWNQFNGHMQIFFKCSSFGIVFPGIIVCQLQDNV